MKARAGQVAMPDLQFEIELWEQGLQRVVGMDEAGRGALAGPVAVGVVCLPPDPFVAHRLYGVRDSKQLNSAERASYANLIKAHALAWAVGFASNEEIDQFGIVPAVQMAALRALEALSCEPQHILIDFFRLPQCPLPQTALIKGDQRCLSIAAASILAKTERDRWMTQIDALYPQYEFATHKGYATATHLERIRRWGACPLHRRSFAPLRSPAPPEQRQLSD
ncbi:MAG: Ribonuclease HII [Anaerolineae bacterium]|jgi:ribonuclease HII|nr:MAG: Ribonuclease HII [Anaerolineae bacterium]